MSGNRRTVCIPKEGVQQVAPIKLRMTLAIERSVTRGLEADPVADHAAPVDAVTRQLGVGRVVVQFVLTAMVAEGLVSCGLD